MPALLKTTQIQEPSSATVNLTLSTSGGVTVGQNLTVTGTTTLTGTPTLTGAVLAAGTASVAPLDFTAGTNLTTAIPGAVEYDGKVFYGTPQSTQRGVIPGAQFYRLNADLVGANVSTAQNILGVGVTLSASTVYAFEAICMFSKTAGTTSHNFSFNFGGTATNNNINYSLLGGDSSSTPLVIGGSLVAFAGYTSSTSAAQVASGLASATVYITAQLKGTVSINAGGTFIPQYTLSAAPGGAYSTVAGSYFLIYPIGASGANTSVGTWA
jgi:hypothetical protein